MHVASDYKVNFSPTNDEVSEIENWLITEDMKTGRGFYCSWNDIKSSYSRNELVTISSSNKTIGFATWWFCTNQIARILYVEVNPYYRRRGYGAILASILLDYLKSKGAHIVTLQCSQEKSELFWKHMGFEEFLATNYEYTPAYSLGKKELFKILVEHLQTNSISHSVETIELWNVEPYRTKENTPPTFIWNLEYIDGTRKLVRPIIRNGHSEWRIRWSINGKTIIDSAAKHFKSIIALESFVIISELTN